MCSWTSHAPAPQEVAEIQGLYGPFSFPEKLLQKIWLKGAFDRSAMVAVDGRPVHVFQAGKWNLLGGPDFRGARLKVGERELSGDVELHLRASDWVAHRHASDPAYASVVLHVVLFPPGPGHVTRGADGGEIPVVALLPLLHHDLEEYAAEEAVEVLANRAETRVIDELAALSAGELTALMQRHAEQRWRQKVYFARLRMRRLGWEAACHQTALEILGYRFNRAPMLRVASRFPLAAWRQCMIAAEQAFVAEVPTWNLQGVRPANHPRSRLRQYARWTRGRPDWPQRLRGSVRRFREIEEVWIGAGEFRRVCGLASLRDELVLELCGGALSGTRFDTLMCDGFLPLMTAHSGRDLFAYWQNWFAGDLPPQITRSLRWLMLFDGRAHPAAHGPAQGLLGWLIARDMVAASSQSGSSGRGA